MVLKRSLKDNFLWCVLAPLANNFSMTAILVGLGILGFHDIAADVAIVQGATLATFYVLSANARNLILAFDGEAAAGKLLHLRLLLIFPISFIAYFLSVAIGDIEPAVAIVLILRRAVEWLGEIAIAQSERLGKKRFLQLSVSLELIGFLSLFGLFLGLEVPFFIGALLWAIVPVAPVVLTRPSLSAFSYVEFRALLPHIGSTAVIGISVFVFRITVTALTGKTIAGELFTAFAIGGVVPSIFGQVLAPTLLRRIRSVSVSPGLLNLFIFIVFLFGIVVVLLPITMPSLLYYAGEPNMYRLATGVSLVGGAVMIVAAFLRAHLIDSVAQNSFGPDVVANIFLIVIIPFLYFTFGVQSLAFLYLISACVNIFYTWGAVARLSIDARTYWWLKFLISLCLLIPIFFQISGGLFDDSGIYFDFGGQFFLLPIPISSIALFGGIAILANYAVASRGLWVIFATTVLLFLKIIFSDDMVLESSKLVLLSQVVVPMFGLVLGEMLGSASHERAFEFAALFMLLFVLPFQLLASWLAGDVNTRPFVFFFSIYGYHEYFPAIVAALATLSALSFWSYSRSLRLAVVCMYVVVNTHLVASENIPALMAGIAGMSAFAAFYWRNIRDRWCLLITVSVSLAAALFYTGLQHIDLFSCVVNSISVSEFGGMLMSDSNSAVCSLSGWVFVERIIYSCDIFLFGYGDALDRNFRPCPNNYWLDVSYKFGMFALVPLCVLVVSTIFAVLRQRDRVLAEPAIFGPVLAFVYLVLFESMFNVGMLEPYPGVLSFVIFGMLVSRLRINH